MDISNQAYFGIRSFQNPYNPQVKWCAGTPEESLGLVRQLYEATQQVEKTTK
jgi:hypothetical protein